MKKYYVRNQNGCWHPTNGFCYAKIVYLMKHNPKLYEGIAVCWVQCAH